MSVGFFGPWTLDLQAPLRTAQEMVRGFTKLSDEHAHEWPDGSGAWLMVDDAGALVGFWIVFSERYLDEGTLSSVLPPYARAFLEALTEEIWWRRLKVVMSGSQRWEPLIILEWPPHLAVRGEFAPPGVAPEGEAEAEAPAGGGWLQPTPVEKGIAVAERISTIERFWMLLPDARGQLAVLRGTMSRSQGAHVAHWEAVFPADSEEDHSLGEPLQSWLARLPSAASGDDRDRLGFPVAVSPRHVSFPLAGWLDRDLKLVPPRWEERVSGTLPTRDVSNPLVTQALSAFLVSLSVLFAALGYSGGVHLLSRPPERQAALIPNAEAQPALSVCSASNDGFREEFRCQLQTLIEHGDPSQGRCAGTGGRDVSDLRTAYCGVRDRVLDGWLSGEETFARRAAAQACFNVLGSPYTHRGADGYADPAMFFDDSENRLLPLRVLVQQLDQGCDVYGDRIERRVSGTVLTAHLGQDSALEELLAERASVGLKRSTLECFDAGRGSSVDPVLDDVCGENTATLANELPTELAESTRVEIGKVVDSVLGGARSDDGSLLGYLEARYPKSLTEGKVGDPLLDCYRRLRRGGLDAAIEGRWDLSARSPRDLDHAERPSQLRLDAALLAFRDKELEKRPDDAICWEVVEQLIAGYTPVHPLAGSVDQAWPSSEQQLCGQVCAGRYRLAPAPDAWVTPHDDVRTCVSTEVAGASAGLDRLGLPWNRTPEGQWVTPQPGEVCAFHLIAQGYLPDVLPEGIAPEFWAGKGGTGIAGGSDGLAVRAANALSSYGGSRSRAFCGSVAAQCFAEELVEVLGDDQVQPYEWRREWERNVGAMSDWSQDQLVMRPWCRAIRPHLGAEATPSGDLDYTCALGVLEARDRFSSTIDTLASSAEGEGE